MTKTLALCAAASLALLLMPVAAAHGTDELVAPFVRVFDDGSETMVYQLTGAPDLQTMDVFETYDVDGEPGLLIWNENNEVGANTNPPFLMEMAFTYEGTEYLASKETSDAVAYTTQLFRDVQVLAGSIPEHNQQTHQFLPYSAFNGTPGGVMESILWTTYGAGAEGDFSPGGCTGTLLWCGILPVTADPALALNAGAEPTSYTLTGPQNLVDITCDDATFTAGEPGTITCTATNPQASNVDVTPGLLGLADVSAPANFALAPGDSQTFTITTTLDDEDVTAIEVLATTGLELTSESHADFAITGSRAPVAVTVEPSIEVDGEGGGEFDSLELQPGESYAWKFTEEGTFLWHDHFYAEQIFGTIVVGADAGEPATHTITIFEDGDEANIDNWSATPQDLTVALGDIVVWENTGTLPHRFASNTATGHEHVHSGHDEGHSDHGDHEGHDHDHHHDEDAGIPSVGAVAIVGLLGAAGFAARRRD